MSDPAAPSPLPPEPSPEPTAAQAAAPQATPTPPTDVKPAVEGTGLQPNMAAALASFLLLVGGIVFLVLEKKDQFVRFYAMQSVFLGGLLVALSIAMSIAFTILHGVPLIGTLLWLISMVIRLGIFVAWVVTVVKAYSGKEWEIPYIGKLARQQLSRTPMAP